MIVVGALLRLVVVDWQYEKHSFVHLIFGRDSGGLGLWRFGGGVSWDV